MNAAIDASSPAAAAAPTWGERNQRWLVERIAALRDRIPGAEPSVGRAQAPADPDFVPALQHCAELFGLSGFERDVLLLCAGVALDQALARSVAAAGGHAHGQPTFALAMSVLEDPHWDALSPQRPLRHWRLLEFDGPPSATAPLRIDERIAHYLTGVAAFDERLEGMVETAVAPPAQSAPPAWIAQALQALAGGACVQLQRTGATVTREDALSLLATAQRDGMWIHDLPQDASALARILRLVDREAAFAAAVVVLDLRSPSMSHLPCHRLQSLLRSPLLVLPAASAASQDHPDAQVRIVQLPPPTPIALADDLALRAHLYGSLLPADVLRSAVADACEQFAPRRQRAIEDAARGIASAATADEAARQAWAALREHSRDGLDQLATRIESDTRLDDLVLPAAQADLLSTIARQLRHRHRVHHEWGFAAHGARGLGLATLFTGESGTGKTLAAEAIANDAGLDLYRVDLASTVSKYIGETEKNLKRIFDTAEASGAVLLFDEADALFGKRSEVKDSHDRYANIETAYLLQRIEAYRGLAILTTNMKASLDKAFLRRIRFVVQFPFPDEAARASLWQRQFPPVAPLADDVHWEALARLQLAGGHIRSIAINAAFAAAHEDAAIAQRHLVAAAHAELAKLERSPGSQAGARP